MSLLSFADVIYRVRLEMHGVGACVQGAFISVRNFAVRNKSTRTIKKEERKITLGFTLHHSGQLQGEEFSL